MLPSRGRCAARAPAKRRGEVSKWLTTTASLIPEEFPDFLSLMARPGPAPRHFKRTQIVVKFVTTSSCPSCFSCHTSRHSSSIRACPKHRRESSSRPSSSCRTSNRSNRPCPKMKRDSSSRLSSTCHTNRRSTHSNPLCPKTRRDSSSWSGRRNRRSNHSNSVCPKT